MEAPKLLDNNVIIDNKAGNGTVDYVDLLPTELWRIIIFHLGEGESARLARCCKKLNNYVSNIKIFTRIFLRFDAWIQILKISNPNQILQLRCTTPSTNR
jgi:hypothetical protein